MGVSPCSRQSILNPTRIRTEFGTNWVTLTPPVSKTIPEESCSGYPQPNLQLICVNGYSPGWRPFGHLVRPRGVNAVILAKGILVDHFIRCGLINDTVKQRKLAEANAREIRWGSWFPHSLISGYLGFENIIVQLFGPFLDLLLRHLVPM